MLPPPADTGAAPHPTGQFSETYSMLHDGSSLSSIHPSNRGESVGHGKRNLLLVYVHGFHGTAASFQQFPAHVHNLVSITLSETHVVRTKVYPRYRSRRSVGDVARDLSRWLGPNESDDTDVILMSHSMGGLVAAETAMSAADPPVEGRPFRHHIIGTINFDVPFLGLHPVVIGSGIASIFRPAEQTKALPEHAHTESRPSESRPSLREQNPSTLIGQHPSIRTDTLSQQPGDGNFNPAFVNDPNLSFRKGWRNMLHFASKHAENLRTATMQLVDSHAEFGGAMADYSGLHARYRRIRALDDEDEVTREKCFGRCFTPPRIRFVNYYTASTGRRKKASGESKSQSPPPQGEICSKALASSTETISEDLAVASIVETDANPRNPGASCGKNSHDWVGSHCVPELDSDLKYLDTEEHISRGAQNGNTDGLREGLEGLASSSLLGPHKKIPPSFDCRSHTTKTVGASAAISLLSKLPPHSEQDAVQTARSDDTTPVKDSAALSLGLRATDSSDRGRSMPVQNDVRRSFRTHEEGAKKSSITDQGAGTLNVDSDVQKSSGSLQDPSLILTAAGTKDNMQEVTESSDCASTVVAGPSIHSSDSCPTVQSPSTPSTGCVSSESRSFASKAKQTKDRKFCNLPRKIAGKPDPAWVRVRMTGVDEITAHCVLFDSTVGDTYEMLVGDVGGRIETWVGEEMTRRLIDGCEA